MPVSGSTTDYSRMTKAQLVEEIEALRRQVEGQARADTTEVTTSNAAKELRDSRDHLRLITDNLPVLISYFDTDQRFHFVNKTAQEWYGRREEEILGRTIKEIICPNAYDQLSRDLEAALSGKERCFEDERTYPDGKKRAVETTFVPNLNGKGEVQGCFSLVSDVSDRKRAEKELHRLNTELEQRIEHRTSELQASEARMRAFCDNSPAAIYLKDLEGRFIMTGRTALDWYGLELEEILGKTSHDWHSKNEADVYVAMDRAMIETGRAVSVEEEHVLVDGETHTILVTSFPVLGLDGTLSAIGGIDIDITERKRAEEALLRAQDELLRQARLATLGQLTATVSHELRNPLGVIRTSAFILRKDLNEEASLAWRSMERIERSVVRCDRIIDELLDFTRIQNIELEPTLLETWLEETLNEQALPSDVTLRSDFGMPDMTVPLDRDRFQRAIINVFDNACQAMTGEGRENTGSEEHTLTVRTLEHDGRVEVVFEDTGPGIPPDVYEKIFEPLYSTKGFGVGLGLPVVKQIMEQHDGGIEIESEEGRGTRVCLWLPTSPSTHGLPAHGDP